MSLAVSGRGIKILNQEKNCAIEAKFSIKSKFKSVCWSKDNKWLCSASAENSSYVLRFKEGFLIPGKQISIPNITACTFYNNTNRSVAVGTKLGELYIWDNKDNKASVKINSKPMGPIERLTVNSSDNYLASVRENSADINIYGLNTNKQVTTLHLLNSKEASALKFSSIKKGVLGAASFESVICVWDIIKAKTVFKWEQTHLGSCSDISFSPVSEALLASSGFDKTLKLFDFRQSKAIGSILTTKPIQCVDIISSGKQIAAGSTVGSVIIYDLRNLSSHLFDVQVFDEPVECIQGQINKLPMGFFDAEIGTPQKEKVETDLLESRELTLTDLSLPNTDILEISKEEYDSPFNLVSNISTVQKKCNIPSEPTDENVIDSFFEQFGSPVKTLLQNKTPSRIIAPTDVKIIETPCVDSFFDVTISPRNISFAKKDSEEVKILKDSLKPVRASGEALLQSALLASYQKKMSQGVIGNETNTYSTPPDGHNPPKDLDNEDLSPILTINSTVHGGGDAPAYKNKDHLKTVISELKQQIQDTKDEIQALRALIIGDIRKEIFWYYCCSKMERIGLKLQVQQVQKDIGNMYSVILQVLQQVTELRQEL